MSADCSGAYSVPSAGLSVGLYVAPDGDETIVIGLTPGFALEQGPSKRVSHR